MSLAWGREKEKSSKPFPRCPWEVVPVSAISVGMLVLTPKYMPGKLQLESAGLTLIWYPSKLCQSKSQLSLSTWEDYSDDWNQGQPLMLQRHKQTQSHCKSSATVTGFPFIPHLIPKGDFFSSLICKLPIKERGFHSLAEVIRGQASPTANWKVQMLQKMHFVSQIYSALCPASLSALRLLHVYLFPC